jgi:hypothetical protein
LLPLPQAFVSGAPVQTLDYGGRWIDTDNMYALLQGGQYRLKPEKSRTGVWSIDFTMRAPGSVNGAIGTGTLRWEGNDTDTPRWPSHHGLMFTSAAVFTPNQMVASDPETDAPEVCPQCGGSGLVLTCLDDLCIAQNACMHGDGEAMCEACKGSGEE